MVTTSSCEQAPEKGYEFWVNEQAFALSPSCHCRPSNSLFVDFDLKARGTGPYVTELAFAQEGKSMDATVSSEAREKARKGDCPATRLWHRVPQNPAEEPRYHRVFPHQKAREEKDRCS